ncbi:pilin [Vibrio taketomensis]|uniref:pilin n=1 Tax=Vibrio taketomensis TaxID=2572923 RepID=UPI0013899D2C|nr:type IV pilin subunit protein [Vibrio taketomensis]
MIVVAIIGILTAFAVPAYQNYTKKATLAEFPKVASSVKLAVELCAHEEAGNVTDFMGNCVTKAGSSVPSIALNNIIVTAKAASAGVAVEAVAGTGGKGPIAAGEKYILTSTYSDQGLTWVATCNDGSKDQTEYCPD